MEETNEVLQQVSSVDSYLEYAGEQLGKYKDYSILIRNNEITPIEINKALAEYSGVNLMLIAEDQRMKAEVNDLKLEFQAWWDEKMVLTRRSENDTAKPASKWLSKAELESEVRFSNKKAYRDWKLQLNALDIKASFVAGLLNNWKKFDGILIAISNNLRQEMRSLSLESRANETTDRVRTKFIAKD